MNLAVQDRVDPVTYEVVSNRLWQISQEGKQAMIGVAASPIVVETRDCFGCVCLPDGTPVEGMPSDQCVASVIRLCGDDPGIFEGDMFLINDPWLGPKHAPDVTLVAPVHHDGQLVAWVGSMTHHLDIGAVAAGGRTPGATDVYHEGLRIPPIKLIERGTLRTDLFRFILNMVRSPEKCALDYKAQVAANNVQRAGLVELFRRYGAQTTLAVMKEVVARAERRMRARLRELPDGTYQQTAHIDTDGVEEKLLTWVLTVTKVNDELTFDFTGTDRQVAGPINAPLPATRHSITGSLNRILCAGKNYIDSNAGVLRPITIIAPEGTLVNPRPPAPCSAALGAVVGALSQGCIAQMLAASDNYWTDTTAIWPSGGGVMKVSLSGTNQYGTGYTYTFMDNVGMGGGARALADGLDSGGDQTEEPGISNIETHEAANPILFLYRRELPDSGGAGMYRGGVAMEAMFIPYRTDRLGLSFLSYGIETPIAMGIEGGLPGACAAAGTIRNSNVEALLALGTIPSGPEQIDGHCEPLPHALKQAVLNRGDAVFFRTLGGSGYADPLDRDPQAVARDVTNGRISVSAAHDLYGVVLDAGRQAAELLATAQARTALRRQRLGRTPAHETDWQEWHRRRHITLGHRVSEYLEIVRTGAGSMFRCRKCANVLGSTVRPLSDFAHSNDLRITDLRYLTHELVAAHPSTETARLRIRELLCPSCATRFAAQLVMRA